MIIDFKNINDYLIPLKDFDLSWRFTDSKYKVLPDSELNDLKPLGKVAANFIHDYLKKKDLHCDFPFKKGFFRQIESIRIGEKKSFEIKEWLLKSDLSSKSNVFLSWDIDTAMIVPFKLLVKYFDDFYYSSSDDLTVFQKDLNWALFFFHEDIIYYGIR